MTRVQERVAIVTSERCRLKTNFLALLTTILFACSCSDSHHDTTPAADPVCTAIMDRCHSLDTGSGIAHDCHVLAEMNNGAMCRAQQAACFAGCVAASDASAADVATDAVTDVASDAHADAADGHGH